MKTVQQVVLELLSWTIPGSARRMDFRNACAEILKTGNPPHTDLKTVLENGVSTARMHARSFSACRGICRGREVVVMVAGRSIARFAPIPGAVYIGVDEVFRCSRVPLDYLFVQDYSAMKGAMSEIAAYRKGECRKFYGLLREEEKSVRLTIPESDAVNAGADRYRTAWWPFEKDREFSERFAYDLCTQTLATFDSVVFPALQFALWTCPSRIYVVGCDRPATVRPFIEFRSFARHHYPETEIVSVNPVGLEGVFTDLVQEHV